MTRTDFPTLSGSITAKIERYNTSLLRSMEWTKLLIAMDDGKPSEEFRKTYPTIRSIVFRVGGRDYEYDADMVLALLDWWKEQHT